MHFIFWCFLSCQSTCRTRTNPLQQVDPESKLSPTVPSPLWTPRREYIQQTCLMQWSDSVVKNSHSVLVFFLSPSSSSFLPLPLLLLVAQRRIKRRRERVIIQTGVCVCFAPRRFTDSETLSTSRAVSLHSPPSLDLFIFTCSFFHLLTSFLKRLLLLPPPTFQSLLACGAPSRDGGC